MTFAAEIQKTITERSTLVRINPGRFISTLLASEGGGVYALTMPGFDVSSLKRNGTALTAVTIDPPTTNDTYYFDQTTGRLAVKLASAPNSTSNVVICYHYLYYTSGTETEYYRTPDVVSGSKVYWNPRIVSTSPFNSSIDGIEAGIVSIPDASVDLNNSDYYFANYLTDNDSFFNKVIEIWHEVNGKFIKAYSGIVTSIPTVNDSVVSISFSDQLSRLNATALLNDDFDECYHTSLTIPTKDLFKPIRFHAAEQTYFDTAKYSSSVGVDEKIPLNGLEAVCTDFTSTISASTNREWTLCRVVGQPGGQSWGTITRATAVGTFILWKFPNTDGAYIGDTMEWNESSVDYWALIVHVGDFTYLGNDYNVMARSNTGLPAVSTSSVLVDHNTICVMVKDSDGTTKYPMNGRDYIFSSTLTAGSNRLCKITFYNNSESNYFLSTDLDPNIMSVQYKTGSLKNQNNHSDILKFLCEEAGCSVNSASFTAAKAADSTDVSFSIPFINEAEYSPYIVYVQKILESMLGFLKQDTDNRLAYYLLEAPVGTEARTGDNIIERTISSSFEYRDIITEIVTRNSHYPIFGEVALDGTVESLKAKYLHDFNKTFILEHVLKPESDGSLTRLSNILAVKSNRQMTLTYNTETLDLDTIVGDEQTIEIEILPGGSKDIFVTSVSKSEDGTKVSGSDLLGL